MSHPPLAADHIDAPHREWLLGDLVLESGERIFDYRQSFVTHGALNADRSNVVLICAALTATHHRLEFLIGAGKALDPARWFIVATDPIGNGLSTSPSISARQPGMRFPLYLLRERTPAAVDGLLADLDATHRWFEQLATQQRANGFDALDYLFQSWAYEAHDVGTTTGLAGTDDALRTIAARTLVLAPPDDLFNPACAARAAADAIRHSTFVEIPSTQRHLAASSSRSEDAAFLNGIIAAFVDAKD